MSGPKRLIVNAEGFGTTPGANRGIIKAFTDGVVRSTSLAVMGPAAQGAARLARAHPQLGVGLRFVPNRRGEDGESNGASKRLDDPRPEDLPGEVRAQLRLFRDLVGRPPTHLDSPRSVHAMRPVFEALVSLAWEMGVSVRATSAAMRLQLRQEGLPTADEFVDGFYGAEATHETLVRLLDSLKSGTTELACQPAESGDEGVSGVAQDRVRELALLCDPRIRIEAQALGVQLIHYGQV